MERNFQKTPRPEVVYGGIFPTKEMIIDNFKKIKREYINMRIT